MNLGETLQSLPHAEHLQRIAVIEEALEWLHTPFVSEGRVKTAGTDCAQFLACVFINTHLIPPFEKEHLPEQWHLHTSEEKYIDRVLQHAGEIEGPPLPGDIALFHVKKAYAHGGIVLDWPKTIIHCLRRGGVQWGDPSRDAFLIMEQRQHPPRFFSVWNRK